jgi:anti-sigma regulatory factor (Ser/Thr protein kinase)
MHMQALTMPATLDSLGAIGHFVMAAAAAAGLTKTAAYRLRLAVDEFATNIIVHGYGGACDAKSIHLRAEIDDALLTVTLEDEGVAFDPRDMPPPDDMHLPAEERKIGGLGVYLALEGIDRFHYERVGNRNRSVLVMSRHHPSPEAP